MHEDPKGALMHFSVDDEGRLHLVIASELWSALKEAARHESAISEAEGYVRLDLSRYSGFKVRAITLMPGPDDPPCDDIVR